MSGSELSFADGTQISPSTVIWATGFALDHSFIQLPVFDDTGMPVHQRGVTASPGVYFLGLQWQHTRGSALLGWVKDDAEHLADHIARFATAHSTAATEPTAAARCLGAAAAMNLAATPEPNALRGELAVDRRRHPRRASDGDDDLAACVALSHISDRLGDVAKRVSPVDDRRDLPC